MKITIIGAGAMGAALTFPLAAEGHTPVLYGTEFDTDTLQRLRAREAHPRLKRCLPEAVELRDPDDLAAALKGADAVVLGVNTKGLLPAMNALLPYLEESVPLVTLAKGMVDLQGEALPIAAAVRGDMQMKAVPHPPPVACLVGPSIADETARGVPTIVHLASDDEGSGRRLAEAFSGPRFHCRYSSDPEGVEICSAYKNIYTIALSWPTGLSEQDGSGDQTNLKAILFLQTLDEMRRLSLAGGGDGGTVWGIAGLGDLITTADAGRNGALGKLLGAGKSTEDALADLADQGIRTIEGYETAKLGLDYARKLDLNIEEHLPLLGAIHKVLHSDKPVREVIDSLDLSKPATP